MAHKHSSKDRKKHKKDKSRKHHKEKKHKKKKLKHSSDSSDSSSPDFKKSSAEVRECPSRSEWGFFDRVMSDSNIFMKSKKEKKQSSPERPGQNIRELNPYWKNNGCGLPVNKLEQTCDNVPESTSSHHYSNSITSYKDYSSDERKNFNKVNLTCDSEQSKPIFLKPCEDDTYQSKTAKQRNWKKKDIKQIEKDKTKYENINKGEEKTKYENFSKGEEKTKYENFSKGEETSSSSKPLSDEDLNKLASKLVKAEIMGNTSLVIKLKAELEAAKNLKKECAKEELKEVVILTDKSLRGKKSPLDKTNYGSSKRQKLNTHDSTGRICYFPDDEKYSLQNLFEKEKTTSKEDILLPVKMAKNSDELDDVYLAAAASNKMQQKMEEIDNRRTIKEALVKHKTLEGCSLCLDNRKDTKHLIVSTGNKCYLSLPEMESLTTGHCLIVPLQHEISTVHLDEDVWDEIKLYQRQLAQRFLEQEQDVIFFENARSFKHFPHCLIHCVPLDKEIGSLAPIYFQKAISESETEWSNNKKVIDFRKKDLRRSIPKGLPYFAVSFGTEGGFAHIIEDEYLFKKNFAEEVLGGMLGLEPRKWRKPQKENFRTQREKTLEFLKMWKKFEMNENSSCSDSSSSE